MIIRLDEKLTQYSFLTNSGGAIAVLGFMGSGKASPSAVFPLAIFLVGIICSGIEYRSLLKYFYALYKDADKRKQRYDNGCDNVKKLVPPKDLGGLSDKINHWAGIVAQIAFVLGAIVGVSGFLCGS
jgi:hypothetical protein